MSHNQQLLIKLLISYYIIQLDFLFNLFYLIFSKMEISNMKSISMSFWLVSNIVKFLFLFYKMRFSSNIRGLCHFYCNVLQKFTVCVLIK